MQSLCAGAASARHTARPDIDCPVRPTPDDAGRLPRSMPCAAQCSSWTTTPPSAAWRAGCSPRMGLRWSGEAGTIAAALAAADELRPDAALVDVGLPDGDGVDAGAAARALPWHPRVVLTSTDPEATTAMRSRAASARSASCPRPSWRTARCDGCSPASEAARAEYGWSVSAALRVVIGEDDVLLREGIARLLAEAGLDVVAQAGDADDFLRKTLAHRPDVAVVDVQMPPRHEDDGLRAAMELRDQPARHGRARAVAVLRGDLRARPDRRPRRGRRLPAQGARRRRRRRSSTRSSAWPRGGSALDPEIVGRMLGRRRASGPLDELTPARARRARRDGRGQVQPRHRARRWS